MSIIVVEEMDQGVVEGIIAARLERGLLVTLDDGSRGFLPSSQIDVRPVRDLDALIGERYRFDVINYKKGGSKVLSRRTLLERARAEQRALTLARLVEGGIVEGVVSAVMPFEAFIDLGGIDGLLRLDQSSEAFHLGDRLRVRISSLDTETERIELALLAPG